MHLKNSIGSRNAIYARKSPHATASYTELGTVITLLGALALAENFLHIPNETQDSSHHQDSLNSLRIPNPNNCILVGGGVDPTNINKRALFVNTSILPPRKIQSPKLQKFLKNREISDTKLLQHDLVVLLHVFGGLLFLNKRNRKTPLA